MFAGGGPNVGGPLVALQKLLSPVMMAR